VLQLDYVSALFPKTWPFYTTILILVQFFFFLKDCSLNSNTSNTDFPDLTVTWKINPKQGNALNPRSLINRDDNPPGGTSVSQSETDTLNFNAYDLDGVYHRWAVTVGGSFKIFPITG